MRRRVSDTQGVGGLRSSVASRSSASSRTNSLADLTAVYAKDDDSWNDDSFVSDYGVPIDRRRRGHGDDGDPDPEVDLDESDSDSILDLHTPLP